MTLKFSELLDKQRLQPLWHKAGKDAATRAGVEGRDDPADPEAELGAPEIPRERPLHVLQDLEAALHTQLESSSVLLGYLLHPLRSAVAKLDPQGERRAVHPMQRADSAGIPKLIDRLEDALTGLVGTKPV